MWAAKGLTEAFMAVIVDQAFDVLSARETIETSFRGFFMPKAG